VSRQVIQLQAVLGVLEESCIELSWYALV
jgi:hypothetical protein